MVQYEGKMQPLTLIMHIQTQPHRKANYEKEMIKMKHIKHALEGIFPQVFYLEKTERIHWSEPKNGLVQEWFYRSSSLLSVSFFKMHAAHVGLLPLKSLYMIPNSCLAWGSPEIRSFRSPWGMKESMYKICLPHDSLSYINLPHWSFTQLNQTSLYRLLVISTTEADRIPASLH